LISLVSGHAFSGPIALSFRPDTRVLAFTFLISLATGLLFGLTPALQSARLNLASILKSDSRAMSCARPTLRKALVILQVVMSLLLLIGAALFVRTLMNLEDVSVGYARENLLLLKIDPGATGYKGTEVSRIADDLRNRFAGIPGVRAVTFSENGLFSGPESIGPVQVEGYSPANGGEQVARFDHVGPDYFAAVGIPILLGRDIGPGDGASAPRVAVINDSMARFYFQNANPIGKKIFWLPGRRQSLEIVGVSANVQDHSLRWQSIRRFYVPLHQPVERITNVIFEVRTRGNPADVVGSLRKEIAAVDPNLLVLSVHTLESLIDRFLLRERLVSYLASFFGVLAVVLASVGLYGVMSYSVTRRTTEIGIRTALGAGRGDIIRLVLRETMSLVLLGIVIGVPAALAAARLASNQLFGLKPHDPWTIAAAIVVIVTVSCLAGYLPARKAARVDPIVALRTE
jgi:predicted permease